MTIGYLLAIFQELLKSPDSQPLRKQFMETLNEYIDFRIKAVLNTDNLQTSDRKIMIDGVHDVVSLIMMLNSAPMPPEDDDLDSWLISYKDWFEQKESLLTVHTYNRDTDVDELK